MELVTVAFFRGVVRNCIEESKFYNKELVSAEPIKKQRVVSMDQEVKATHEICCIQHQPLLEVGRTKIEYDYKASRKRLLKGMSVRYTAIICPAKKTTNQSRLQMNVMPARINSFSREYRRICQGGIQTITNIRSGHPTKTRGRTRCE